MFSAHVACELHMSLHFRAGDGFFGFAGPVGSLTISSPILVRGGPDEPLIQVRLSSSLVDYIFITYYRRFTVAHKYFVEGNSLTYRTGFRLVDVRR